MDHQKVRGKTGAYLSVGDAGHGEISGHKQLSIGSDGLHLAKNGVLKLLEHQRYHQ